jgi:hypothetical protein
MAYFAVIGKIRGDKEVSCMIYCKDTKLEAEDLFKHWILGDPDRQNLTTDDVLINYVLKSESPIE